MDSLNDTRPEGDGAAVKSIISILLDTASNAMSDSQSAVKNLTLALALLISSRNSTFDSLSWIPNNLSLAADSFFRDVADEYAVSKRDVVIDLLPQVAPYLKEQIEESSISKDNEADEVSAACARAPVAHAILAAYQFRWFITQVCLIVLISCLLCFSGVLVVISCCLLIVD